MSFKTLRHKIKNIFNQTQINLNELDKKSNDFERLQKNININKKKKVLYDSDWFDIDVFDNPTLIDIDNNLYAYIVKSFYGVDDGSTIENVEYFLSLNYGLEQIIDIPEKYLPFIESTVLVKQKPNFNFYGASLHDYNTWDTINSYYRIKGDSTLIYQGFSPDNNFHTEDERINGDFSSSLCGKWFNGTLKYNIGGDFYELTNSYITSVGTIWDVVPLGGHPGYYSYKGISGMYAIDSISSSSVIGTGTYYVITAYEDEYGQPQTSVVSTKNITMQAPLFVDNTSIKVSGNLYKNGVYQGNYSYLSPLNVNFIGTIGSGTATLISFSYTWNEKWRIFYSAKRARAFIFYNYHETPQMFPTTSLYETGTLPYTKITVEKNPDDYPEETTESNFANSSEVKPLFAKITDKKFKIYMRGTLVYSELAMEEYEQTLEYINEEYTQVGDTYNLVTPNRPGKLKTVYLPPFSSFKIKFQLILDSKFNYSDNINYQQQKI